MQPEGSLPPLQAPITCPYPEPEQIPGGIKGQNIRLFLSLFKKTHICPFAKSGRQSDIITAVLRCLAGANFSLRT